MVATVRTATKKDVGNMHSPEAETIFGDLKRITHLIAIAAATVSRAEK